MNNQNTFAILAMCAIVITCYALRASEAHYLPDLFGLALALAAPHQIPALAAWLVAVAIRHTPVGYGLADTLPRWLLVIVLPAAYHMSISDDESSALESAYKERISTEKSNDEMVEIPQPVAEKSAKIITLGESEILARLVLAKKIGLTEAVQIGAAAKSGKTYQECSTLVKAAMERQRNHYPAGSNQKRFE